MRIYETDRDCCGCSACVNSCPQGIIELVQNDEGFLFPQITNEEKCINCLKCHAVCPMKNHDFDNSNKRYYVAISDSNEIWEKSSSGGIVYTLGQYVIKKYNGVVFGAKWNGLDVVYDYAETEEKLGLFCKSKYVAADPGKTYAIVKSFLQNDRYVMFTGTPCAIDGLRNYLNRGYEKLLLIDFACHGQGSPVIFKKWIFYLEEKKNKKVEHFEFRQKKQIVDHINSNCCSYRFSDGTNEMVTRDYYHHTYVNGLCMRKSCEECVFAEHRGSDLTLADFKKQTEIIPFGVEKRNISTVICQTEQGENVINSVGGLTFYSADVNFIEQYNPKLIKGIQGNRYRDAFMRDVIYNNRPIYRTIKKYAKILPTEKLEFNCSHKVYKRFYILFRCLDYFYLVFRKVKRIIYKETV